MADFAIAYQHMGRKEGGYAHHPNDKGKETWAGISRRYWPGWEGWARIDVLRSHPGFPRILAADFPLREMTEAFYRREFWSKINGDLISSQAIADEVFEQAVNFEVDRAVRHLQLSLNFLNRRARRWADLPVTGNLLTLTIGAIERCCKAGLEEKLLTALNALQGAFYILGRFPLVDLRDDADEEFAVGWLSRVTLTRSAA